MAKWYTPGCRKYIIGPPLMEELQVESQETAHTHLTLSQVQQMSKQ